MWQMEGTSADLLTMNATQLQSILVSWNAYLEVCVHIQVSLLSCHGLYAHIFLQVPVDRPLGTFLSDQRPLLCKCFEGDLTGSAPSFLSSGHIAHKRNGLRRQWDESFHSGTSTASGNSNTSPTPSQLPLSNMSCYSSSPVGKVSVSVRLVLCS